jgi:hypothetical protein
MKTRLPLRILLLTSAVVLLFAGCSQEHRVSGPVQPQVSASPDGGAPQFLARQADLPAVPAGALRVSRLISARNGGEISLGIIKVSFPRNALRNDAMVTLSQVEQERFVYRVEPADLVLLKPVTIKVGSLDRTTRSAFKNLTFYRISTDNPVPLITRALDKTAEGDTGTLGDFALGQPNGQGGEIQFLRYLSGPGYETELIQADHGGMVSYDRFTLRFPKGALTDDTYITIRNPGDGYLDCELEPHGIQFLQPVQLEMDLSGLHFSPFTDWTVYWYNDANDTWENQGGQFNWDRVTVDLHHFSTYRLGRAGW